MSTVTATTSRAASRSSLGRQAYVVLHLARRQLASDHRLTLVGWLWPLVRQVVQLAVLVFIFGSVLDLGIDNFPLFVFVGLLLWNWFASSVSGAASAIVDGGHLLLNRRLEPAVLPMVSVLVPLVDLAMGLPVLIGLLVVEGKVHASALWFPVVLLLEFGFIAGMALLLSALNVYFRDVLNLVALGLLLGFYMTPIFYGLKVAPKATAPILKINPMARLIEMMRDVLIEGHGPRLFDLGVLSGVAALFLGLGYFTFRRLQGDFIDYL